MTISNFLIKFKQYSPIRIAVFGFLSALIILSIVIDHKISNVNALSLNQNHQSGLILNQVSDIRSELGAVAANTSASQLNIDRIAKTSDVDKLSMQLNQFENTINSKLLGFEQMASGSKDIKDYLDPSILPFKIISIDVLSGNPFVSIDYDNHITPFGVGDTIAGWQIASADYDSSEVEFKNKQNQSVKISLKG